MVRIILIVLIALIAIIAVASYFLRPEPPRMPYDADHASSHSEKECLSCHGPGQKNPRKPTHPIANDCFRCHTLKDAA
jgi:cytochrome c553